MTELLTKPTEIDGKLWLPGTGKRNKKARVLFVTPCVLQEEAATEQDVGFGKKIKRTPRMLDCAHGVYLKDVALKNGIDINDCYWTSIIKYLPENRNHQSKPLKTMMDQAWPYLEAEIAAVQPEIIVCVGKLVFDQFAEFRARESEVIGAWFRSNKYGARIFMIPHITQILKAEKHEAFALAFRSIRQMLDSIDGVKVASIPIRGSVIHNATELREWVQKMKAESNFVFSVDCEWHGHQHVDGKLRSLQIAWSESDVIYIRFMDDKLNYVFDVSYKEAGAILGEWLNNPLCKYIGHHLSVDLTWMAYWLGLEWCEKGLFDTEFAQQCVDESIGLGLDELALRYTDFGKYDWQLIEWKKAHSDLCKEGYGYIPDEILIPYGWKDVLTVFRSWGILEKKLKDQDLMKYYTEVFNPLVTDVITHFCIVGLPIDRAKIDGMRDLYNWAKRELQVDFQRKMTEEADRILEERIGDKDLYETVHELTMEGKVQEARNTLKTRLGADKWPKIEPVFEHFLNAPNFNDRSKPQMMRWLFDVKRYTPVKSTPDRANGTPAVQWEKVLTYPPEAQARFTPATDTQTLEILAAQHSDDTIRQLLMLNAVGNICKSFLRPAEVDEEGEVVGERGLHYWIASDDRIHLNHSTTETGKILLPPNGEIRPMKCFNCWDGSKWIPISSQAPQGEGSTTIPEGSTPKPVEMGTSQTDKAVGEDIV